MCFHFPSTLMDYYSESLFSVLCCCLLRLPGLLRGVSLYAVGQVSLTISATQSSEVMKHSVQRMWQEIHICLLCFTLQQRCSSVCSSEKCWGSRTYRNNCVSVLSKAIGLVLTFFIVIKRLQWNIKPAKPCISGDVDNNRLLPESIINPAIKYSIIQ